MNDGMLIELVRSYPNLYDKKRSDFKDVKKKINSWTEIAALLEYTVEEVQNRWKYLREKYVREKNGKKLPTGSGTQEKVEWDYFKSLKWLDPYILKRRTKSSLCVEEEVSQDSQEIQDIFSPRQDEDLIFHTSNLDVDDPLLNVPSTSSSTPAVQSREMKSPETPRLSKKDRQSNAIASTLDSLNNCVQTVAKRMEERKRAIDGDEDDLFGRSVTAFLRKLPPSKKKARFKKDVFCAMMVLEEDDSV